MLKWHNFSLIWRIIWMFYEALSHSLPSVLLTETTQIKSGLVPSSYTTLHTKNIDICAKIVWLHLVRRHVRLSRSPTRSVSPFLFQKFPCAVLTWKKPLCAAFSRLSSLHENINHKVFLFSKPPWVWLSENKSQIVLLLLRRVRSAQKNVQRDGLDPTVPGTVFVTTVAGVTLKTDSAGVPKASRVTGV